jgi:class 3 adenylate cyclase
MAEERLQRRLAAILSADVVGYSSLMGLDEAGTLSRLNALRRELIDPTIAAHAGRIVKLMGDGALVCGLDSPSKRHQDLGTAIFEPGACGHHRLARQHCGKSTKNIRRQTARLARARANEEKGQRLPFSPAKNGENRRVSHQQAPEREPTQTARQHRTFIPAGEAAAPAARDRQTHQNPPQANAGAPRLRRERVAIRPPPITAVSIRQASDTKT